MALDMLTIAAATGSDGGLGKIGTVPATSGTFIAHIATGPEIEKVEWLIKSDNAGTYQFYRALTVVDSVTLTLSSLVDTSTIIVNGLTFIAETTELDALASARKFYASGDNADAIALAALINDATYGIPGVVASAATNVVTLVPAATNGATVIQAVTGTAGGKCVVASTTTAGLVTQGAAVVTAANTGGGVLVEQSVNGWPYAYIGLVNTDGDAATYVLKAARQRYRE